MSEPEAEESVVLVDAEDNTIGTAPKHSVHLDGRLHRAISIQIVDSRGRLLVQRRHRAKYHSGGLWTNTCCSHPRPGEAVAEAALRRLREEMGIETHLRPLFTTLYRLDVGGGMIEHELTHVHGGIHDGSVLPDPAEVDEFCWLNSTALQQAMSTEPERFSAWFHHYLRNHWQALAQQSASPTG